MRNRGEGWFGGLFWCARGDEPLLPARGGGEKSPERSEGDEGWLIAGEMRCFSGLKRRPGLRQIRFAALRSGLRQQGSGCAAGLSRGAPLRGDPWQPPRTPLACETGIASDQSAG